MKKLILITLLSFITSATLATNKFPKPKSITTHLKLPAFNSIHITGFVNVIIKGTDPKSPSDAVVESRSPQWVTAEVKHHILYLRALYAASLRSKAPTVKVHLYQLNRLDVFGRASVTGKNIKSDGLFLRADTTRDVYLNGNMVVTRIRNLGPGHIHLRWVKGNQINIQSLAGQITLAGKVDQLQVKLANHAKFDGQFLRANHVSIKTRNFATAKVLPIYSLRAFATDFSNVYYYKTPQTILRYTRQSGNVLQLGKMN